MEKEYRIENTIRGEFYVVELTKRYPGMPGFAPEYHDNIIGRVVVKFREDKPYFQTGGNTYEVLEIEDIEEIKQLLERGYKEEDFISNKQS